MQLRTSKAAALLGGVASLALLSSFLFRTSASESKLPAAPCAPRLLALEKAVCDPLPKRAAAEMAELSLGSTE